MDPGSAEQRYTLHRVRDTTSRALPDSNLKQPKHETSLDRHCERQQSNPSGNQKAWIASSRSLSSGAHSRDPLAPCNDAGYKFAISRRKAPE
jgi:hypothetical protein